MKRRGKIPGWRFQAVPVFRDVAPGNIAVPLHERDGSVASVNDFPAKLVARMERAAKGTGLTFAAWYTATVAAAVKDRYRGF